MVMFPLWTEEETVHTNLKEECVVPFPSPRVKGGNGAK